MSELYDREDYERRVKITHGLMSLLLSQGKLDEARDLIDRFAARCDWEVEQMRERYKASAETTGHSPRD